MTAAKFNSLCSQIYDHIRSQTPYDTGNLHDKATKIQRLGDAKVKIFVDEAVAPYFKYVNNRQTLTTQRYPLLPKDGKLDRRKDKPKVSHTRQNRNYHYFEEALEEVLKEIARETGATLIYD